MAGNFFRGTTVDQDPRWGKSDKKLISSMTRNGKFAPILETKINVSKINLDIIERWVSEKLIDVLGYEDDIVINLVVNMLHVEEIDPKKFQIDITGFLSKKAPQFMEELWALLVDAQNQPSGIPSVFIQKKKEEILKRQVEQISNELRIQESSDKKSDIRVPNERSGKIGGMASEEEKVKTEDKSERRDSNADRQNDLRRRSRSRDRNRYDRRRDEDHRRSAAVSSRGRDRDRGGDKDRDKDRDRDRHRDGRRRERSRSRSRSKSKNSDSTRSRSRSKSKSPSPERRRQR